MSTLNLPAIIARLHHASDNYVSRHDGYKNFKLPEIRHVGVGDRGLISLTNNESFWKNPIYLDQVLRRHIVAGEAYSYPRYMRKKRSRFLPKIDAKPVLNTHTTIPYVKGLNVEGSHTVENANIVKSHSMDEFEDDEDATWTRNALDGNTSQDIVKAYEKSKKQTVTSKQIATRKVTFSRDLVVPPIKQQDIISQNLLDNSSRKDKKETTFNQSGEKHATKLTLMSFDGDQEIKTRIPRKFNLATNLSLQSSYEIKSKMHTFDHQSTFSRILKQDSNPKTQAGKKLLSSLLQRTDNENRKAAKHKKSSSHTLKSPSSVLYNEEYVRLSNSAIKHANKEDKKYGVGITFDKLPAEVIGHHFQQTYEQLWKYLINNGRKNIGSKSYFQTKAEMHKISQDAIYIPTGRPEEAFHVEGLQRKTYPNDVNMTPEPIKLKYNHRGGEDHTPIARSKDTSPWDIDKELRTPDINPEPVQKENHKLESEPIVQFQSKDYILGYNGDGIRQLSITLPPLETRTPPCTPTAAYSDFQPHLEQLERQIDCEYCDSNDEPFIPISKVSRHKTKTEFPKYPVSTHKKTIDFETPKNTQEISKVRRVKAPKVKGPVPTKKLPEKEENQIGKSKSRVYSHGQYHVKVEEKVVHRRKPKLPKDLSNMFTKPYTFSYLTGVKAPCNLSNGLFSGKVANLSTNNGTSTHESKLVSKVYNKLSYDIAFEHLGKIKNVDPSSSMKMDAYTQLDSIGYDSMSLKSQDADREQSEDEIFPIVSPMLSTEHAYEIRLSPTRPRVHDIKIQHKSPQSQRKKLTQKKMSGRKKRLRSLSEGAGEEDIKIYRATVKTYDASKFFKGAKDCDQH